MRLPGFNGGSYQDQSRVALGERCINLIPERFSRGGKSIGALYPAPGFTEFATFGDSPGRGIFYENGRLFAVYGTTLYEVDSAGTPTARGVLAIDSNPAAMSTNGDGGQELLVSSGDTGYIFDLSTNVLTSEVSDIQQIGVVDGFFVGLDPTTSTLKISEALDGKTWDPTQISQRSSASDLWRGLAVVRQEIVLLGDKTGEVWFNAGRSPFPFAPRNGATFDVGIVAAFSLAKFGSSCAWLGQPEEGGLGVFVLNGYTPERISPPGLDYLIQTYADDDGIDDAIGWSYSRDGHAFYVLQFPSSGRTHVYDGLTQEWHERGKWNPSANDYGVYRGLFHAQAFEKNLVCDSQSNKMYSLSSSIYTDVGGDVLRRARRTPHLSNENQRIFFDWAELECERGVGLTSATAQGYDPEVMLRYSNDGGFTWGAERTRKIGKRGVYGTRVRWQDCGSGRDRVWEWSQSDPVPSRWFDAYVGATVARF